MEEIKPYKSKRRYKNEKGTKIENNNQKTQIGRSKMAEE